MLILELPRVTIWGSLVRNARFGLPDQYVSSRFSDFLVVSPCLWGRCFHVEKVSNEVIWCHMPFLAGVALRDIVTCLRKCRQSFCVTGAIPLQGVQKMSWIFRGRRSTLDFGDLHHHFAWQAQHFRRVVVRLFVRVTLSGPRQVVTTCKFGSRGRTSWEFTLYTPHSTLYTLHFTLRTLHLTFHTPHFTLYTPHSTLYTLHSTLYTLQSTLYTLHFALHTRDSTLSLYTSHLTLDTWHFALHNSHTLHTFPTQHSIVFALPSMHSTPFHTPQSTLVPWQEKDAQDCWNSLFQKSVLRDCMFMCFDICTVNICVSIRVRGLHLVWNGACISCRPSRGETGPIIRHNWGWHNSLGWCR